MRASVTLVALLVACGGNGEAAQRAPDALDCTWVQGEDNCWRTMAKALDACLGTPKTPKGTLAADGLSCTYAGDRTITATMKLGATDNVAPPASPERDFTVKNAAGADCVHVQESNDVLTVSFAGSALKLDTQDDRIELTCPDGRVFKGDSASVRGCLAPSGGIPGYAWSANQDATQVSFALLGMSAPLYACAAK